MTAYYNEHDPYAAQWLRNLITAGHIARGIVDERSIEDIRPGDLAGFTQCHFFAGVGVWSYALRLAGWRDDQPVWTGSCPCQPFSAAGKGGGFDDERHLWPAWFQLIAQCKPVRVYGEQVASKDGLAWLDLVHTDLENAGYSVGAVDLCAAGVGAPHIRQRAWFVADSASSGRQPQPVARPARLLGGHAETQKQVQQFGADGPSSGRLAHRRRARLEGQRDGPETAGGWLDAVRPAAACGESVGVGNTAPGGFRIDGSAPGQGGHAAQSVDDALGLANPVEPNEQQRAEAEWKAESTGGSGTVRPGPTNGHWRDVDWLYCRDGKWRPVESGTFPLAHGATARVGRLRAYGNAINAQAAEAFIRATL